MTDAAPEPPLPYRRLVKTPALSAPRALASAFSRYASLRGRSRRSEFWWLALLFAASDLVVLVVDSKPVSHVALAVLAITLLPYLATGVRRLHDTGRSSWWMLLLAVPVLNLLLLVWWSEDSGEDNRYGPYPKWETNP